MSREPFLPFVQLRVELHNHSPLPVLVLCVHGYLGPFTCVLGARAEIDDKQKNRSARNELSLTIVRRVFPRMLQSLMNCVKYITVEGFPEG